MQNPKLIFSAVIAISAILVSGAAPAADMAPRTYARSAPIVQAQVYDWTGFYVGGELGGQWGRTNWNTTSTSDFPGTIVDASTPRNYNSSGFRVGGYAGYNWQVTNWVIGLEGSGAWSDATATSAGIPGCTIACAGTPGPGVDVSSVKLRWDASARVRIGYLVTPSVLFYGTGGVAWQGVQTSGSCQHTGSDPVCSSDISTSFDTQTNSKTLTGWTVGGGIEAKISGNWLLRGEYRYANFGRFNGLLPFNSPSEPAGTDFVRYNASVSTQTATVGLAYQFGGPAVARY